MDQQTQEHDSSPGALDEIAEPLVETSPPREPHTAGDSIVGCGEVAYKVECLLHTTPRVRVYEAHTERGHIIWLHEALGCEGRADLLRTAEVSEGMDCPMFPRVLSFFERDGRTYLAGEPLTSFSFADALRSGNLKLPQILPILAQVAFALARLHKHGWVHLGLRPRVVLLGKPLKLTDLAYATRLGEVPAARYYLAGYSPPELLKEEPIDVRGDIYAVGAMLFHAVYGRPIAETGTELMTWDPPVPIAGVPQILHRCLGERESRYARMEDLHQDLLRLARRITRTVYHSLAATTSIGLESTRTTNQDAFGHLSGRSASEGGEQVWSVACVADGMGGMEAGELASEAAVEAILAQAAAAFSTRVSLTPEAQAQAVRRWVQAANEKVCSALEGRRAKGGCTLVCACLVGPRLTIAHVGDCRIYLIKDDGIGPLTSDHSLPMALVRQGEIPIEAVRTHPDRSRVLRSLGDRRPMPDYFIDGLDQTTGAVTMELHGGEILLLCSDGVWEPLDEESMLEIVRRHRSNLPAAADALVAATLERGAPDNATVLLLRVDENPEIEEA